MRCQPEYHPHSARARVTGCDVALLVESISLSFAKAMMFCARDSSLLGNCFLACAESGRRLCLAVRKKSRHGAGRSAQSLRFFKPERRETFPSSRLYEHLNPADETTAAALLLWVGDCSVASIPGQSCQLVDSRQTLE